MSVFAGFHRKVTLPVMQNLVAAAVGATGLALSQGALGVVTGCSPDAVALTRKAETFLIEDRVDEAAGLASDALVLSPNCGCVIGVRAAIEHRLMRAAISTAAPKAAETHRAACYAYARRALPWFGGSPRAEGLLDACSAERVFRS